MTEETLPDTHKPKRKKHVILLTVGVVTTVIAQCFSIRNPNAYTAGALAFIVLRQPIAYFVILGIVAVIAAAIRKNVKRFWFPFLAWLFLAAGLFDIVVEGYTEYVLRPQIDQGIQELIASGKIVDLSQRTARDLHSRLLGHWASEDDLTHLYFSQQTLIVVNLGQRKDVTYRILESNPNDRAIKFEVSGADYTPHTRTMVFLDDGTAWQVMESSLGAFKSKLKYIGKEDSP
ncbi:MAG TPA: hypothetical protein VM219_08785 [Phycisphaerae bacterium]|nr:hypothetical protein [Phycisphaerae bacterium]